VEWKDVFCRGDDVHASDFFAFCPLAVSFSEEEKGLEELSVNLLSTWVFEWVDTIYCPSVHLRVYVEGGAVIGTVVGEEE